MPIDLAIDFNTGDLLIAPNNDAEVRTGLDLVNQRIRVRLKIWRGKWILDPTNGTLGSGLRDAMRLPMAMALQTIPLLVREALDPMSDILVTDVVATPGDDPKSIDVTITFQLLGSQEQVQTAISITG